MIGRRIRRLLWRLVTILATVVVLAGALLGFFWATNPDPAASPGWSRLADMPGPRGEVAAANVGARLVVAGGLRGLGGASEEVSVYQIERDEWAAGEPLPSPRHHAAASALEGWLYVSGGASSATAWTPRDDVWRSRPGGAWRTVEKMPEGRQGHAMVSWGGRLYVIGGVGDTDRTLIYRSDEGWATGTPLPIGRDHLRAAPWGDEIWVLGGRTGDPVTRVDAYDPRADRWRRGPDLPKPTSAMAVGVVDDELHVVGGEDPDFIGGGVIPEHFVLTRGGREWRTGSRPVLGVHGAGFAVHGGRLIIAGGASRQGALSVVSWTGVTQVFAPADL